jgi:VIT1/CCC1 family predicted Fe2+/Mn2+ transporter
MLSLVLSTIAFFVAGYFAKRYLDDVGIPKGMTRSVSIFCIAAAVSYLVAFIVDWIAK